MKSVTIPDSVGSIGDRAFSGCERLDNVIIPVGVDSISKANPRFDCASKDVPIG